MIFKAKLAKRGSNAPRLSVAVLLCVSLLFICSVHLVSCGTNFYYSNSDKYSVGGASLTQTVSAVDIEWLNGRVNIKYATDGASEISFSESSDKEIEQELRLHYWLDGATLRIKFAASGRINVAPSDKTLSLTLPADIPLLHVNIVSTSADINVDNISAERISLSTASGSVSANGIKATEVVDISSISGNIYGNILSACQKLSLNSVTGGVEFETSARLRELFAETTSGKIKLANLNPAKVAYVESVSGSIELIFLDNAQFEVSFNSVSGKFQSEFSMMQNGNNHICGSPNSTFRTETVSGDIIIKKSPT